MKVGTCLLAFMRHISLHVIDDKRVCVCMSLTPQSPSREESEVSTGRMERMGIGTAGGETWMGTRGRKGSFCPFPRRRENITERGMFILPFSASSFLPAVTSGVYFFFILFFSPTEPWERDRDRYTKEASALGTWIWFAYSFRSIPSARSKASSHPRFPFSWFPWASYSSTIVVTNPIEEHEHVGGEYPMERVWSVIPRR